MILLGLAAAVHLGLQRRKNEKYLSNLTQDLAASQRIRLSAYEGNYAHVGQPSTNARSSTIQPNHVGWSALESQEHLDRKEPLAQLPDDSPMPPRAKRKKSLRDSIYGHSGINVPKTRRQKKIAKAISLKDMNRSPLSAITEMTDSTEPPGAVELPTERTPRVTPERDGLVSPMHQTTNWSLPVQKRREAPMSPVEIETPISLRRVPSIQAQPQELQGLPKSASIQSDISEAPGDPLPPLPVFDTYKSGAFGRRHSQMSTETVSSSVLGSAKPSPADTQLPFQANSGMQDFDFGFSHRSSARVGPSPGRTTGWHSGRPGVASVTPSFDFQGRQWSTTSATQSSTIREVKAESKGEDYTPLVEHLFGPSKSVSKRHSMLDYSTSTRSQQAPAQHKQAIGNVSPTSLPPRPASVASSNPHRLDYKPSFASSRLSSGSTGSERRTPGHRRQNCVRISIPIPTRKRRPSNISEILEDTDDEIETSPNKVQIVDITKVSSADRNRGSARRSIVDANGSPTLSPLSNRPVLSPSRGKRTASYASRNSPVSRPESDVFYSTVDLKAMESKPKTPDPFANPDRWALAPTPPSAMTLNPPSAFDSPTLPSPLPPLKITSNTSSALTALPLGEISPTRKPRPLGPRSPPPVMSSNVHLQKASSPTKAMPASRIAAQAEPAMQPISQPQPATAKSPAENDLRKSVTMLRSMDSSGRHLNTTSRLYAPPASFLSITSSRNNHDDWKELNAIWEVSRSNTMDSVSTRAPTRDNSIQQPSGSGKRGHRQSLSQGVPFSSVADPVVSNYNALSRNNSSGASGNSGGYGMQQGAVSAGGGYLPQDSSVFNYAHSRQPSMFGSSKRKMSMNVSHGQQASQNSLARNWQMSSAGNDDSVGNVGGNNTGCMGQSPNWGQYGNMSRAGSPGRMSMMSISGMSIWEDESIRGDSPEPPTRQQSTASRHKHQFSSNGPPPVALPTTYASGPGPALPSTTTSASAGKPVSSQPAQSFGVTTTVSASNNSASKPKPIIFDDNYSQAHLVSPLNDSDMENMTPTAHTFGNSRYTFNFPAVPTTKRVPSRGNMSSSAQQNTLSLDAKSSTATISTLSSPTMPTPSSSILNSPSLQPQPLRSHLVNPAQQLQQQVRMAQPPGLMSQPGLQQDQRTTTPKSQQQSQPQGLGLRVGDRLLGTPGSLRSLYDGEGFLKESPLRGKLRGGITGGGGGNGVSSIGASAGVAGAPAMSTVRGQMIRGEGPGWARR